MTERLLILGADQPPPLRVTQRVSPRVVIVAIDDESAADELRSQGVAVLEPGDALPPHVRETLTDSERMFVDAFAERARPKTRPGDGLDWDAAGFLPPDPPKKR